jgi:hypothetical protein
LNGLYLTTHISSALLPVLHRPETGRWPTGFDYCRGICRTTSRSTSHENSFILDRKHCFSQLGRPLEALPPSPPMPAGAIIAAGEAGRSCADVCAAQGRVCIPEGLAAINDCNSLRTFFSCEAGCGFSQPHQAEFPGYVTPKGPKNQWPAMCATLGGPEGGTPELNCTYSVGSVQRLCACVGGPAGGGEQGVDEAGALAEQESLAGR